MGILSGAYDQNIREVFIDPVIPITVSFTKIDTGNAFTQSKMVILRVMSFQAKHQVSHTVTGCELTEDHAKHLIPTSKCPDFLISVVLCDNSAKDSTR